MHGSSFMSELVVNSPKIQEQFITETLPLRFVKGLGNIGKWSFLKFWRAITYAFIIIKTLLKFRPDLVYFTNSPAGFAFYRDAFYIFLIKQINRNIALHLHGRGIKKQSESNTIFRKLARYIFKDVSVICLSQPLTQDVNSFTTKPIFVVPNGIPSIAQEQKNYTKLPSVEFLCVSNLMVEKGILDLIAAFSILSKKLPNVTLTLIGKEAYLTVQDIQAFIDSKGLSSRIQYVGAKYGREKEAYFRSADVFVFASHNEAFPLVLLEAMQFGLPIIASNVTSIQAIIQDGENGLLASKKNPTHLAECMERLAKDYILRKQVGEQAQKIFYECYTLPTFEENMSNVFNAISTK